MTFTLTEKYPAVRTPNTSLIIKHKRYKQRYLLHPSRIFTQPLQDVLLTTIFFDFTKLLFCGKQMVQFVTTPLPIMIKNARRIQRKTATDHFIIAQFSKQPCYHPLDVLEARSIFPITQSSGLKYFPGKQRGIQSTRVRRKPTQK